MSSAFATSAQEFSYFKALSGRGGPQGQVALALAFDQQGNALVGGRDAAFVTKLDPRGRKIFYRALLGNAATDRVDAFGVAADGSVYVAGANSVGGFLARLNSQGDTMWYRTLSARATAIALDRKGGVYYASAGTISKLDAFTVAAPGSVSSLALGADGTLWAAGDGYVARLDSTGEGWNGILHLPEVSVRALTLDTSGTPYIAALAGSKAFVGRVLTDALGLAWRTELATSQTPNALAVAPDGTLLVSGDGPAHGFLTVIDSAGRIMESSDIGDSPRDRLNAVATDQQGHTWVAGSTDNGIPDVLLARAESISASIANRMKAARPSVDTTVAPFATASTSPLAAAASITLGTNSLTFGHGAGTGTLVVGATGAWTASTSASWLHVSTARGTGSTLFQFTYDANNGVTRTGTVSFNSGAEMLAVTQAGESYVPARDVTTLVSSGPYQPEGVAVDDAGNVYIANGPFGGTGTIQKYTLATGQITTLLSKDFSEFTALALDRAGNVYFSDNESETIQKWTAATSQLTTLVSAVRTNGVAVDGLGNVYFSTPLGPSNTIQKWTAATGQVTTLVSTGSFSPEAVAVDGSGNVYFTTVGSQTHNDTVQEWKAATGQVTTLVSGLNGPFGVAVDRAGNVFFNGAASSNGGYAIDKWAVATGRVTTIISSGLDFSIGLAVDNSGNLFIAETGDDMVKQWSPATGQLTTLVSPLLNSPTGVAADELGNVYIADGLDHAIKKWTATTGQITTLVPGVYPSSPYAVAVDRIGNVYFTDANLNLLDKWTAATGRVTPLVAGLNNPTGMALDGAGNAYVVDNNGIHKWTASTGRVTTLISAGVANLAGLAADAAGNVYFFDYVNQTLQKWAPPNGQLTTLISGISVGSIAVDGSGNVYALTGYPAVLKKWTAATHQVTLLSSISARDVAVDTAGTNVYLADPSQIAIRKFTHAYVAPPAMAEPLTAGSGQLPILPASAQLNAYTDAPWLTVTGQTAGSIRFSFTATTSPRTNHIFFNGQLLPTVTVSQVDNRLPTAVTWLVSWGSQTWLMPVQPGFYTTLPISPWQVDRIGVLFSKPIASGDVASLSGVTATALTGLGTNLLSWTIDPVSFGSFTLSLAQTGPNALKDTSGNPLTGNSSQTLNVLLGDFNGDGLVNAADLAGVNLAGSGNVAYSPFYLFADLNGDDSVDALDLEIVRTQIGKTLP